MLVHQSVRAGDEEQALEKVSVRAGVEVGRLALIGRYPAQQPGIWRYAVVVRQPGEAVVSFRLSEDSTAVWVDRIWGGSSLTLASAQAYLALLHLTHGVVEGALAQIVEAWQAGAPLPQIPVAQTPPRPLFRMVLVPEPGLDGALVRAGEAVARVERTSPGHTVFGQTLTGRGEPGLYGGLRLRAGDGVVATQTGTVVLDPLLNSITLEPLVRLDEDKVTAHMDVPVRALGGAPVTLEILLAAVQESRILPRFIRDNAIRAALAQAQASGQPEREVLIAASRRAVPGEDGRLEMRVLPPPQLEEDSHGRINVYELGALQNVKEGELLGIIVPPLPAERGEDLFGNAPQVRDGQPLRMTCGPGVIQRGEELLATREGALSLRRDRIDVVPLFVVDGDVDPQVGNLDFMSGAILIRGSVRPRLTVRAAHQVFVGGDVDGGIILSGGDVLVRGAIIGGSAGRIEARGRVCAASLLNAHVQAQEDVILRSEASHSVIETRGRVRVVAPDGWLCGGETDAREGIMVARLGGPGGPVTVVRMGETSPKIVDRLQLIAKLDAELAEAQEALRPLAEAGRLGGLSAAQRSRQQQLLETRGALQQRRERALAQIRELGRAMPPETAEVRVYSELFPGVRVEMRGQVFSVGRSWGADRITYDMRLGELRLVSTGGTLQPLEAA